MIFLSKWVICRFHVNLPGCTTQSPHGSFEFSCLSSSPLWHKLQQCLPLLLPCPEDFEARTLPWEKLVDIGVSGSAFIDVFSVIL